MAAAASSPEPELWDLSFWRNSYSLPPPSSRLKIAGRWYKFYKLKRALDEECEPRFFPVCWDYYKTRSQQGLSLT
jgi:hypothetical protein|eukprot:scaffold19935_cov203-Skeletonema_marinoi.AAC.5